MLKFEFVSGFLFRHIPITIFKVFTFKVFTIIAVAGWIGGGCAYRWGAKQRSLPGGHRLIQIPIFKNLSPEPGIEVSFTQALIRELERSRIAVITNDQPELKALGQITSVTYSADGGTRESGSMPSGAVLSSGYWIRINVHMAVLRQSDQKVLWESDFQGERNYVAPQVTQVGINTVNPLYNLSARRQNIEVMARDLMNEVFDRMSEQF